MKQLSLAATDFVKKPKQTRREKFLGEMEVVVPWTRAELFGRLNADLKFGLIQGFLSSAGRFLDCQ